MREEGDGSEVTSEWMEGTHNLDNVKIASTQVTFLVNYLKYTFGDSPVDDAARSHRSHRPRSSRDPKCQP